MTYLTEQQTMFPIYRVVDGKRTRIGIAFTAEAANEISMALNQAESSEPYWHGCRPAYSVASSNDR